MKIKYYLLFPLFFSSYLISYAQQAKRDSLDSLLAKMKNDTTQLDFLNKLAYTYLFTKPDSTILYAQKALSLAIRLGDKKRQAIALSYLGGGYRNKGNLTKGLEYYLDGLRIAEKIQNMDLVALHLELIGLVYLGIGNNELALGYYQKALPIINKLNKYKEVGILFNNMGKVYINLYKYDSAQYFLNKALPLIEKYALDFQSSIWINTALIQYNHKNYQRAKKDLDKALVFAQKFYDRSDLSTIYQLLAEINFQEHNFDLALSQIKNAIRLAEEGQIKEKMYKAYETYSKLLETKGDWQNALKYTHLSIAYKDSIRSEMSRNALQIYEYEKKKVEINLLKVQQAQKNAKFIKQISEQRFFIFLSVIVIAFMGMIMRVIFKNRQKISKMNKELQIAYFKIQQKQEEILAQNEEMQHQQEEISALNNHLESLVEERTKKLLQRNNQLNEYAFFNAHKLRAPIATILGLYQLLDLQTSSSEKEFVIEQIKINIILLDRMVHISQGLLDELDLN